METTLDGILGQRLTLEQPRDGFRIAIDTIMLAASVAAQAGQTILDLGCGVGGAMLCLAARAPDTHVTGIDIQKELIDLCQRNIERNGLADRAVCQNADIMHFDGHTRFDHVMMNPPYHDKKQHDVSANPVKRTANTGNKDDLGVWIETADKALRPEGMLTLIHRADRMDEIVAEVKKYFGTVSILPLLPKEGTPAKRVLLRATKVTKTLIQHCCPIILHGTDGHFTEQAENTLRHAYAVEFIAN
jgi:tRNA1(Val) A37 N6-methylase TrmN6